MSLRKSEFLKPAKTNEKRHSIVGSFRALNRDIFRDTILTPHAEMSNVMEAHEQNTFINSAAETAKNFIIGDGIKFKSNNSQAKNDVEIYWEKLNGNIAFADAVLKTILTGNGYNEKDFYDTRLTNGILVPNAIYAIPDSSQIYINSDPYGKPTKIKKIIKENGEDVQKEVPNLEEYYIQRVNPAHQNEYDVKSFNISYNGMGINSYGRTQIYGIPLDKRKITHYKLTYGRSTLYGRSQFASAMNDHEMLFQIERAIATIAKYKAVPKKIWQYGNPDMPATDDELGELILYLRGLSEEDDILTNKPVATTDLSYSGKEINLDYAINHIKRKMIAGVSLDFLSGMGQDVNRATAQTELLAFILSIYSKRQYFLKIIQEEYINPFLEWKGYKPKEVEAIFPELDFETKSEKESRVRSNWQSNMITFNEMREQMEMPTIPVNREVRALGDKLFGEVQMDLMPDMGFGGGFDTEQSFDDENENTMYDILYTGNTKEKIVRNPTGTALLQNQLAVNIRKAFRSRLNNVLAKIDQNKTSIERTITTEAGLKLNVLEEVINALEDIGKDILPVVKQVLNKVWTKAFSDVSRKISKPLNQGDIRKLNALQKNAFGFIKNHENDMRSKLRLILTEGISQGDSITTISKEIKEAFKTTAMKADRIARTEVIRTYTHSSMEAFEQAGIAHYKWITAGDNRVCEMHCAPRHNQIYKVSKGPVPPEHPNCRCAIIAHFEEGKESYVETLNDNIQTNKNEIKRGVEMYIKKISYATMVKSYKKVLQNPVEYTIFYKSKGSGSSKKVTLSFIYNSLMVVVEIKIKDLLDEKGIVTFKNEQERKQIEEELWRAFETNYLKHAIPEEA